MRTSALLLVVASTALNCTSSANPGRVLGVIKMSLSEGAPEGEFSVNDEVVCEDSDNCEVEVTEPGEYIVASDSKWADCAKKKIVVTEDGIESSSTVCDDCPEDEELVTICHHPFGNPDNFRTLRVPQDEANTHLTYHNDESGPCPGDSELDSDGSDGEIQEELRCGLTPGSGAPTKWWFVDGGEFELYSETLPERVLFHGFPQGVVANIVGDDYFGDNILETTLFSYEGTISQDLCTIHIHKFYNGESEFEGDLMAEHPDCPPPIHR